MKKILQKLKGMNNDEKREAVLHITRCNHEIIQKGLR